MYKDFIEQTKANNQVNRYYQKLIDYTPDILLDISLRNQNRVAQDLGLTSVKFSHLLPMLKELYESKEG